MRHSQIVTLWDRQSGRHVLTVCLILLLAGGTVVPAAADANHPTVLAETEWATVPAEPGDDYWLAGFYYKTLNDEVNALAIDGARNVYVGGRFTAAGGVSANHIAKWNGTAWSPLGEGVDGPSSPTVSALAVDGEGTLYAGGSFTIAGGVSTNYIARWDGAVWSPLGSGMNAPIRALALDGSGTLYAAGTFTTAGGVSANHIAKWNGTAWSPLGSGMEGAVYALAVNGAGLLYAGGGFSTAGGVSANSIATWNGARWSPLSSGVTGTVNALAVDGNGPGVYVAGNFTAAGGVVDSCVAKWNGTAWLSVGNPIGGDIFALAVDSMNSAVYAGGNFYLTGGNGERRSIAKWNGTGWSSSALGNRPEGRIYALAIDSAGFAVYAGGRFRDGDFSGVHAANIEKWDGRAWSSMGGNGVSSDIFALAVDSTSSAVYVGGSSIFPDGVSYNHIAKWDGARWSPLSGGINGVVYALAVDGAGNVYAGGQFWEAGGVSVNNVARWNGTAWSPLGSGVDSKVYALAVDGAGMLYAGGEFGTAGGVSVNCIAKWDGARWSPLGEGVGSWGWEDTTVRALAVDDSGPTVYAGGSFELAGWWTVNNIAKWDGGAWSALGSGMDVSVSSLAVDDTGPTLYAGGAFSAAGGVEAGHIAKWNGSDWSPVGNGLDGSPFALVVDSASASVYAGGLFTSAGGVNANHIAKWDGTTWLSLGSGLDGSARALAVDSVGNLYAGGTFEVAGGKESWSFAQWIGGAVIAPIEQPGVGAIVTGTTILSGFAIHLGSSAGTGIDAVQIYLDGPSGTGTYVGQATYGLNRPDVAAQYGVQFAASGWELSWNTSTLSHGVHYLILNVHHANDNTWTLMPPQAIIVPADRIIYFPLNFSMQ